MTKVTGYPPDMTSVLSDMILGPPSSIMDFQDNRRTCESLSQYVRI